MLLRFSLFLVSTEGREKAERPAKVNQEEGASAMRTGIAILLFEAILGFAFCKRLANCCLAVSLESLLKRENYILSSAIDTCFLFF